MDEVATQVGPATHDEALIYNSSGKKQVKEDEIAEKFGSPGSSQFSRMTK